MTKTKILIGSAFVLLLACTPKEQFSPTATSAFSFSSADGGGDVALDPIPSDSVSDPVQGDGVVAVEDPSDPSVLPPSDGVSDEDPVAGIDPPDGGVVGGSDSSDSDGDGVDNGDDNLEGCFDIVCKSDGLSSARVVLNGDIDICSPSDFARGGPKENAIVTKRANPESSNSLDFFVAGKPGSRLTIQLYDCKKDPSELLRTWVIQRTSGAPSEGTLNF